MYIIPRITKLPVEGGGVADASDNWDRYKKILEFSRKFCKLNYKNIFHILN